MTKIRVYTDGGCMPSKNGAAGFVALKDSPKEQEMIIETAEYHEGVTSNQMELQAMLDAVRYFVDYAGSGIEESIEFCSDSKYVINGINSDWFSVWEQNDFKKANGYPVKNVELWRGIMSNVDLLYDLYKRVKFVWVRGKDSQGNGDGDIYNEMVDAFVSDCMNRYEQNKGG